MSEPSVTLQRDIQYTPALDGRRIAVFGDIHGRADLLAQAHARLDRHVARDGGDPPLEIYLGDYIDRGPASAAVLNLLIARGRRRDVVCLRGNHEAMLLDALHERASLVRWLDAGGRATLASYGISAAGADAVAVLARASGLRRLLPPDHLAFLAAMPIGYRIGSMFLVHAGVRPGTLLERQRDADLLWIREPFLSSRDNHGALIVHGHSPVRAVEFRTNRINVDTGAVFSNTLTCLLIADDGLRLIGR